MIILLLCLKIFFVRIIDVSLGTFRTILLIKDKKVLSSIIAFIEVMIWFAIVREALNTNIDSIWIGVSYAGGFASGTFIGSIISNYFIKGSFNVQVITNNISVINFLRKNGYAVSVIDIKGQNQDQNKYMLFIEIDKKKFNHLRQLIMNVDKTAFFVVNETKYVQNGYFGQEK